jgi:hypothetical protein
MYRREVAEEAEFAGSVWVDRPVTEIPGESG